MDGMAGGHYAAESHDGVIIAKELGFDKSKAKLLVKYLNDAYERGRLEEKRAHQVKSAVKAWPGDGQ